MRLERLVLVQILAAHAHVNRVLLDDFVRSVRQDIVDQIAQNVRAIQKEPCQVVNVMPIVNAK